MLLDEVLLFGLYPEVYKTGKTKEKILYLEKIVESYLYKDILAFQKVRNPQAIRDLTQALAYQVGSEINENELANRLKIDRKTVVSYLDILEQSFVILRLFPYSKNPRREIGKKYKVYFTDVGIRNTLIGDFNPPRLWADLGSLWENWIILERIKFFANKGQSLRYRFWRSYSEATVDYLERLSTETKFKAFEIKYGREKLSKGAKVFSGKYQMPVNVVNQDNYFDFINGGL